MWPRNYIVFKVSTFSEELTYLFRMIDKESFEVTSFS